MAKKNLNIQIDKNKWANKGINIKQNPHNVTAATGDQTYLHLVKDTKLTDGNVEARNMTNNGNEARVGGQNINHADHVYFKLEKELAKKIQRLAILKKLLCTESGAKRGEAWIMVKNVDDTTTEWKNTNIKIAFLDPQISLDDVVIDVMNNTPGAGKPSIETVDQGTRLGNNFKIWRDEWEVLEDLVEESYANLDLDANLETKLATLEKYVDASARNTIVGASDADKKKIENVKKTLYNLSLENNDNSRYYKNAIDAKITLLKELILWRDEAGLTSVTEVLQANANGFIIHNRTVPGGNTNVTIGEGIAKDGSGTVTANAGNLDNAANKAAIKAFFADGKRLYRGFEIINAKQTCDVSDGTDITGAPGSTFPTDSYLIIEGRAAVVDSKLTKTKINNFRLTFADNAENTPETCRGFEPGDLSGTAGRLENSNDLKLQGEKIDDDSIKFNINEYNDDGTVKAAAASNPQFAGNKASKKVFQIVWQTRNGSAANRNHIDDVIKEAFLMNSFDIPIKEDSTRLQVLDHCLTAIKSDKALEVFYDTAARNYDVGYAAKKKAEAYAAYPATKPEPSPNEKELAKQFDKLIEFHQYAKNFLGIFENHPTTEKEFIEWEKKIRPFLNASQADLKKVFAEFWNEKVDELKDTFNFTPKKKDTNATPDEINAAKAKAVSDKAKEVFGKALASPPTKTVLTKLEALVKLLEEVHAGTKKHDDAYTDLVGYKNDTGDARKAWDIAEEVDDGGQKYAEKALKKLEKELKDAKDAAKTDLGDAATDIGIDSKQKVKEINDIKELFAVAKKAWGFSAKSDDGFDDVYGKLEAAQKGDTGAYKDINKYRKNKDGGDCQEGYAAGAWNKVKGMKTKSDININKIVDMSNTAEELWENYSKLSDDDKKSIPEETVRRKQALKKLTVAGLEQDLGKALGEKNDVNDFTKLEDIEKAIETLKKFEGKKPDDGSEEGKILKKLKDISGYPETTQFIKTWLAKLEGRQKKLKEENQDTPQHTPNNDNGGSFFTSIPAIIIYCVLGAAFLGGIAWWFLKDSGESEGGEE